MKNLKKTMRIVISVILVFAFNANVAYSKWDDQSDELPGTETNLTPILIAGGVVITGAVAWLIVSKHNKKKKTALLKDNNAPNLNLTNTCNSDFYASMQQSSEMLPVQVYMSTNSYSGQNDYNGVKVGLRVRF